MSNARLNILQVPTPLTPLTIQQAEEVGPINPILQMERLKYSQIMLPDQRKDWMTRDLDRSSVSKATAAEVAMAKSIQVRKRKKK